MPTYYPSQDGYHYTASSPWGGDGLWHASESYFAVLGTLGPAGLIFDLPAGVAFRSMSLSLQGEFAAVGAGTITLYLSGSVAPDPWGDSNLPVTAGASVVSEVEVSEFEIATWTFDLAPVVTSAITEHAGWNHRLALVLTLEGALEALSRQISSVDSETVSIRPLLTTTEARLLSGGKLRHPLSRRRQPHPRQRLRTE
jgi:hypothetical protein